MKATKEIKAHILLGLHSHFCDSFYRFKKSCKGKNMNEEFFGTGQTRQEILDEYLDEANVYLRAIRFVEENL